MTAPARTASCRLSRAEELAALLGVTPSQIALAYLMHQEFPVITIIGTTDVPHLEDALRAPAVRLTAEQVRGCISDALP